MRPCIGSLYRTAFRMTGDRNLSDDLVQEVCLNAYRGFSGYREGTNFKAWIFRILTNACIDTRRKHGRSPFVDMDDDTMELATNEGKVYRTDEPHGPEVIAHNRNFRAEVSRAMATLDPDVRIVVSLALLEELSYQEIASIVECPIGTVRSRLSRGRQTLQSALKDYMPTGFRACHKTCGGRSGEVRKTPDIKAPSEDKIWLVKANDQR